MMFSSREIYVFKILNLGFLFKNITNYHITSEELNLEKKLGEIIIYLTSKTFSSFSGAISQRTLFL